MNEVLERCETFCAESVFTISLCKHGLAKVPTYIERFTYLSILDLSGNSLSELALSGLTELKHLDVSFNRIQVFALSALPRLQTLRMHGNVLDSLEVVKAGIAAVGTLEIFSLRLPNGEAANPVCYLEVYEAGVRGMLRHLKFLDGQMVGWGEVWSRMRTVTRSVRELQDKSIFHVDDFFYAPLLDDEEKAVYRQYEDLKKKMDQFKLELTS